MHGPNHFREHLLHRLLLVTGRVSVPAAACSNAAHGRLDAGALRAMRLRAIAEVVQPCVRRLLSAEPPHREARAHASV
jgi:hypothetical protein